jgi:hypothetical protein
LDKEILGKKENTVIKAYMAKARLRRGIRVVMLANRIEKLKMEEDDDAANKEGLILEKEPWQSAIFRVVVLAKFRDARESENEVKFEYKMRKNDAPLWVIDMKQELKVLLGLRGGTSFTNMSRRPSF